MRSEYNQDQLVKNSIGYKKILDNSVIWPSSGEKQQKANNGSTKKVTPKL